MHGFGFAGSLAEIGVPQMQLATARFAFNIGVEAGQLAVVAITMVVLIGLARATEKAEARALALTTYAIGSLGSYWLIQGLIG